MILPSLIIPAEILEKNPSLQQWMDKAKQENFLSIGVVGEAAHILPGFLESIEVSDSLLVDSVDQEGKSGSIKVIHGWSDADVSITLSLFDIPKITTDTVTPHISRYDCLAEIISWFKKMKDGMPQIYTIRHPHLTSWGAREFIFNSLKSSDARGKKKVTCTLEFDEYDSTTGKSQDRQLGIQIAEQDEAQNPPVADRTRKGLGELEERYAKL
jgi:hypothetical protein